MDKLEGKREFTYQFDKGHPVITMTLSPESNLSEGLEAFDGFLKAAGYSFEGLVDIVPEDGWKLDNVPNAEEN